MDAGDKQGIDQADLTIHADRGTAPQNPPDFPSRFASFEDALAFLRQFFAWYNDQHCHSGIAFFTPSAVHHDQVDQLAARRNDASATPTPATPNASSTAHRPRDCRPPPFTSTPRRPPSRPPPRFTKLFAAVSQSR